MELISPFCGGVTCVGLKVVVTPPGVSTVESNTVSLKLYIDVIVMFAVSALPWGIVSFWGSAVIWKSGAGGGGASDAHASQILSSCDCIIDGF